MFQRFNAPFLELPISYRSEVIPCPEMVPNKPTMMAMAGGCLFSLSCLDPVAIPLAPTPLPSLGSCSAHSAPLSAKWDAQVSTPTSDNGQGLLWFTGLTTNLYKEALSVKAWGT